MSHCIQEERYSVALTIHLPDVSVSILEAFTRSLHQGLMVGGTKDFRQLSDLQQMLGITEVVGTKFPSLYGAVRTPRDRNEGEVKESQGGEQGDEIPEEEGGQQEDSMEDLQAVSSKTPAPSSDLLGTSVSISIPSSQVKKPGKLK